MNSPGQSEVEPALRILPNDECAWTVGLDLGPASCTSRLSKSPPSSQCQDTHQGAALQGQLAEWRGYQSGSQFLSVTSPTPAPPYPRPRGTCTAAARRG